MTRGELLAKLQLSVDDPMWANHVEMSKRLLRTVIEQLRSDAQAEETIERLRDALGANHPQGRRSGGLFG